MTGVKESNVKKRPADGLARRVFTARTAPFRYLVIPKSGCTFVKNLIWRLDHGQPHPNARRIHDDEKEFIRASDLGMTNADLIHERRTFTIIRNPVDRFFSLYTDKVIGDGHLKFLPLRRILVDKYGLNILADNVDEHRSNCNILLDWIERNLSEENDLPPDPHWTPQNWRRNVMSGLNVVLFPLKDIGPKLSFFFKDVIPDFDFELSADERNVSTKPFEKDLILDKRTRRRINQVYSQDRVLYNWIDKMWTENCLGEPNRGWVPTYGDFLRR